MARNEMFELAHPALPGQPVCGFCGQPVGPERSFTFLRQKLRSPTDPNRVIPGGKMVFVHDECPTP